MSSDAFVFSTQVSVPPGKFWPQKRRQVIALTFGMLDAQARDEFGRVAELWRLAEREHQGYAMGLLVCMLLGQGLDDDAARRREQIDAALDSWAGVIRRSNPGDAAADAEVIVTGVGAIARDIFYLGQPVTKVELPMNGQLHEPLAMCLLWLVASMFYTFAAGDDAAALGLIGEARKAMLTG